MNKIEQCAMLIRNSNNILILTGAGMSTESGIPDFRSDTGLYSGEFQGLKPESILSLSFFNKNPKMFWGFISKYMDYSTAKPNSGHYILAKWEKDKDVTIITQNIEQLHSLSGSQNVIEVHGTIMTATCQNQKCGKKYYVKDVVAKENGFICSCGTYIKPDIVLYEENVEKMPLVYPLIEDTDLLIVLGSSLTVYPVAEIPALFGNKHVIIINRTPTRYNNSKNCIEIHESIGETLKSIDSLL